MLEHGSNIIRKKEGAECFRWFITCHDKRFFFCLCAVIFFFCLARVGCTYYPFKVSYCRVRKRTKGIIKMKLVQVVVAPVQKKSILESAPHYRMCNYTRLKCMAAYFESYLRGRKLFLMEFVHTKNLRD